MPDIELMERTLQYIKDHPEKHDQWLYVGGDDCESAMCFAGWAVFLSGRVTFQQWRNSNWVDTAAEVLGISHEEALVLFQPHNTLNQLEHMVKDVANGDMPRTARQLRAEGVE